MEPYWPTKDVLAAGRQALLGRKPSNKLVGYLEKYQQGLLSTDKPDGLPDFATQRDVLIAAMCKKYAEGYGYHQTLSGRGAGLPKFWELILSLDFISHEIELANNIGYENREIAAGLRSTVKAPYAEFTIVSEDLKRAVAQIAEPAAPTTLSNIVATQPIGERTEAEWQSVTVAMTVEGAIYAKLGDEKFLIKKVRRDSAPYNFFDYMLGHQNQDIPRGIIQTKVEGCAGKKDMTMLASRCGFTKELLQLKAVYFGGTTKTVARFKASVNLSPSQMALLIKRQKVIT